jgi:hypothetical protein
MDDIEAANELRECEAIIERGKAAFFEVGRALQTIRDKKLYGKPYVTFEEYCQKRWDISRRRAYELMDVVPVLDNVCGMPHIPENERQANELARVKDPEQQREVWAEVVEVSGGRPTAKIVKEVAQKYIGPIEKARATFSLTIRQDIDEAAKAICEFYSTSQLERLVELIGDYRKGGRRT